jgi:acetyltransferase-like isoleucine patch superfamily enzyme
MKSFFRPFYLMFLLFKDDLPRLRTLFFVGVGNVFPDMFLFGRVRVYCLMLAGAKVSSPNTCIIRKGFFTENAANIEIGSYVQINRNCLISGHGRTRIGDHVFLSYNVQLFTISHQGEMHEKDLIGELNIDSHTVLYANTIILPNCHIGDHVVTAAGAVVTKSLPSRGIYGGNPAVFIKDYK